MAEGVSNTIGVGAERTSATPLYTLGELAHESDFATPLHHGVIRFVPSPNLPMTIRNSLPVKNDRPFIHVPAGYLDREGSTAVEKILAALGLSLPNLIVTTAETFGSAEEQMGQSYGVQDDSSHPIAKDWTEDQTKEVLHAKVGRLLESLVESCVEVGAFLMPDCPRRRNGAAQMICEVLPTGGSATALGVFGLDADDETEGLTQSLKSSIVPFGSPCKTVSRIPYDIAAKDGAPCPQLTHLLIFESPNESTHFRSELLSRVPDIMLALGNITGGAMKDVFSQFQCGSPVVMMKHTGKNVDSLCKLIRHVREHTKPSDVPGIEKGAKGSSGVPSAGATVTPHRAMKLPPIEGEENELIRLFVNTWPSNFSSESVVLADPIILSGSSLQKRMLAAITATFDLKIGGEETQRAKKQAIAYAWSFYNVANHHSHQKKSSAESLHIQLVLFTLVSIVASVLYDQLYGGAKHPSGGFQLVTFVLTILLPLYVTSLKQESDKGNPVARWAAFKVAAIQIESEIYKFRAQVGPYRPMEKTESAMQKPLQIFSSNLKSIWMGINQYMQDDGMAIPETFWEFAEQSDDDRNATDGPTFNIGGVKTGLDNRQKSTMFGGIARLSKKTRNVAAAVQHRRAIGTASTIIEDAPVDETTPILKTIDHQPELKPQMFHSDEYDEEEGPNKVFVDDKYSPLTADDYLECRMKQKMQHKVDKVERMVVRNRHIGTTIKRITVLSGATAALSLQWLVPIILGVTAALGTGQEFRKYPKRIELGNRMIVQLNHLKLWWMGLSMYEKQLPHNKDRLILKSEDAIITELAMSFDGSKQEGE